MTNQEISDILRHTSVLLDLDGEARAVVRGLRAAADRIESFEGSLVELVATDTFAQRFADMNRVASDLVCDLVTHGRSQMRDDLLERYPEGLVALCKVPGIGQALATRLYHDYDVRGLEALIQAAGAGRLVGVKGLGPKIMVKVLAGAEAQIGRAHV